MIFLRNILIIFISKAVNAFARLFRLHFSFSFDHRAILNKNFGNNKPFYFVQVGANDGVTHDDLFDFIRHRKCFGLALEPIAEYFEQLQENYRFNNNITVVRAGIHAYHKSITLYKVKKEHLRQLPTWAKGIASLQERHHLRSGVPENFITTETAPAARLEQLMDQHYPFPTIDLLQVDVEGYDLEVLKMMDFSRWHPRMVKIEYINLSGRDLDAAKQILKKGGYYCFLQNPDLIGIAIRQLKL